ncbi:uncharacterized protein [Littorina saxatilis]|uniref:Uncharacterized protein n=1 Tax=Littorina saxatilis TaxID=31220 RepID=A0AAN9FXB1_9CAEN
MANKRHVEYSTEELEAKKMLLTPAATKRANINAAKSLRDFLRQKRQAVNFEDFIPEQLNEVLGHFYMGVRTENKSHFKCPRITHRNSAGEQYIGERKKNRNAVMNCRCPRSYMSMWGIHGLSSVLGVPVQSVYPRHSMEVSM